MLSEILKNNSGKKEVQIPCPFHVSSHNGVIGVERTPSCFINTQKNVYFCHGCGAKGSLVKFVVLTEGISWNEAKHKYLLDMEPFSLYHGLSTNVETTDPSENWYEESYLSPYSPAGRLEEKNIDCLYTSQYELKRDGDDLLIPIRDIDNRLIGLQRKKPNHEFSQDLHFKRSEVLFGINNISNNTEVIICEGALDVVKINSILCYVPISPLGTYLSQKQIEILRKTSIKKITLWMDNDSAGKRATKENYYKLKGLVSGEVYSVEYKEEDPINPSDTSVERIQELWITRKWIPLLDL